MVRISWSLLAMPSLAAALVGCPAEPEPMPDDEFCKNVGYAIAGRIFECTGDDERANQGYHDFVGSYTCVVEPTDAGPEYARALGCAEQVTALPCAFVDQHQDTSDDWFTADPIAYGGRLDTALSCHQVVVRLDGRPLAGLESGAGGGAGGVGAAGATGTAGATP